MVEKKTLGKLARERIRLLELPAVEPGVIERFQRLSDLTGTISDVCDVLGIRCAVPTVELRPYNWGKRIVGPALTVRNISRNVDIYKAVADRSNGMGETEAHNLAKPGDVLVVEGLAGCSSMGGLSASIGRRQGEIGVVIDGALRDPDQYARMGWPVWCRGFSPMSGKWRLETVEINGTVHIAGVQCHPGDLVCADEAGICIIPRKSVVEVLEMCEKFDAADAMKQKDIDAGMPLDEVVAKVYK